MDQLNSDLLRTFLAVAETGSMTDGAARIFRSQSAASLQIRKLEELLGQPVFDRHGRGVALTATGERLLPIAHDVTRTLSSAMRELTSDGLRGKLRLGIPDDQNQQMLARIIGEFAQMIEVGLEKGKLKEPVVNERMTGLVKLVAGVGFEPTTFRL